MPTGDVEAYVAQDSSRYGVVPENIVFKESLVVAVESEKLDIQDVGSCMDYTLFCFVLALT